VLVLFILFALASLAFALALSPFFKNARVGAFLGPLLFFLSSQLYNLFLDKGRLQQVTPTPPPPPPPPPPPTPTPTPTLTLTPNP